MLFLRKGLHGYTDDISEAAVFTADEAIKQIVNCRTDIPWPKNYIDEISSIVVDTQRADFREAYLSLKTNLLENEDLPEIFRDQA